MFEGSNILLCMALFRLSSRLFGGPMSHRDRTRRNVAALALVLTALTATGCATTASTESSNATLQVYATTGYLADAVHNIAPDAEVTTMVGPGGDPHTYQPSTKDIQQMQRADVVFWNGLQLEAQLVDQLESLGNSQLAVGDQIPTEMLIETSGTDDAGTPLHDPHIWNSPAAWTLAVDAVATKLGEIDPTNAPTYTQNAAKYITEIEEVTAEAQQLLDVVPEPRILITGHDAFAYFGETFDLDVRATDFISTQAQLSPKQLSDLADLIVDQQVPVIFFDNQANPQAIVSLTEAVRAQGWDVELAEHELYADSLGAATGVDTYLGVFQHNARTVADALGSATS